MQHFISRRRAVPRTAAAGLVLAAAFLGVHAFQALRQRSETEILVTQFHSDTKYGALGEGVAVQEVPRLINGEAKAQQEALRTQDASTDGFLWPDDSFGDRLISTTPSGREGARTFSTPSFLAIFARYADDMYWLEEENTGMMDNSTGTPHFIMPMVVYQSSDIGPKGQPVFPGLPSNPTPSDVDAMPSWPKWAWKYIIQKNSTRDRAFPGSFQEAELRTKLRLGLPLHIPRQREEWEAIESRLGAIKAGEKVAEDMIASITGLDDGVPQEQAGGNGDGGTAKEAADNQEESKKSSSTSVSHASSPKSSNDTSAAADLLQELQSIAQNSSFASTVLAPRVSSVHKLHLVPNRGAEAMPYLTGIIEHYDNLPEIVLFMHGHRLAWHMVLAQDFTMRRLVRFPPKNFTSFNGYMPLGCLERWRNDISQIFPTDIDANWASNNGPRWHEALAARYAQAWREHLGNAFFGMPLPDYVRVPAAASFAVRRETILQRPKQWYEDMRSWLMRTHIENKWLGIVMEFTWGITFGRSTFINPSQEHCLCELYSICTGYSQV